MTDAPSLPPPTRDPRSFVLRSELSEVYLLLDNISSSPEKKLPVAAPSRDTGLKEDWLHDLCRIDWPPDSDRRDLAGDAALLIRVKDHLNSLAQPASGLTIAFTHLVTQDGADAVADDPGTRDADRAHAPIGTMTSRGSLAQQAYPDLLDKARLFRRDLKRIRAGLMSCLLLACALSWYVAFGNAALTQRRDAQAAHAAALRAASELAAAQGDAGAADSGSREAPARSSGPVVPSPEPTTAPLPRSSAVTKDFWLATLPRFCRPYADEEPAGDADYRERQTCDAARDTGWTLTEADGHVAEWLVGRQVPGPATTARASAVAAVLVSSILPVVYGVLGAGTAALLGLSRKMRMALLAPRDITVSLQQLALGAVTGACIGIFVAQPSIDASASTAVGPVAFSASGLSFLAGFGADAVFAALDTIIKRVFIGSAPATK